MSAQEMVLVTGNTFPVKDKLKAMGGVWSPEEHGWKVPAARAEEARALVSAKERRAPSPDAVLVTGNTLPVKDKLRAMGGVWSVEKHGWMVPAARADEALALANPQPRYPERRQPLVAPEGRGEAGDYSDSFNGGDFGFEDDPWEGVFY